MFEFIFAYNTPRPPISLHKKISPIGPAVWSALRNIYTNVLFYYIDNKANSYNIYVYICLL